ncbi:methyltransferase domain-containing protein [Hymenobacter busanensis]|uniref:Methyltransferase domain-containing protein n=1 Tax=Hymenobacter busanensis TaxID=2607656 RepID=A0A7L4ZXG0_9BACT|nr:class I SAM-dependent methyltransferase [Hymenobacter busanensis]KAA9327532.1 methyltransferase domain-containing protein [Hymenobacter busanensis]QHJ06130.1 class I SAM-dependent methyltransferase [Hymenobacter busanensis]
MEAQLEQIREQQKATWNKFSAGWRKWDDFTMDWLRPMGDEIIRSLHIKPTDLVLDVAAGTGEPGLSIASLAKDGKVVITDLAEDMLAVARDKATAQGIRNYETVACDVCELPFPDDTFDAVSCRFGFMFFPDMLVAAQEMRRVLKPGGRLAAAVWGPPTQNAWITAIMGTIGQNIEVPTPPPGAPGMFRCAGPGFLSELFRQAGFQQVTEKEITGKLRCGSNDTYWQFMNEVAAPVVMALSKADEATREKIRQEVYARVDQQYPDKQAALDYGTVVVSGTK